MTRALPCLPYNVFQLTRKKEVFFFADVTDTASQHLLERSLPTIFFFFQSILLPSRFASLSGYANEIVNNYSVCNLRLQPSLLSDQSSKQPRVTKSNHFIRNCLL